MTRYGVTIIRQKDDEKKEEIVDCWISADDVIELTKYMADNIEPLQRDGIAIK